MESDLEWLETKRSRFLGRPVAFVQWEEDWHYFCVMSLYTMDGPG